MMKESILSLTKSFFYSKPKGIILHTVIMLLTGMFWNASLVHAQGNRTIRGIVIDQHKNPVADATVIIEGTSIATSTNERGNFTLQIPEKATKLIVSSIGYNRAEVIIGSQSDFRITINNYSIDIEETVVVGYGTQKRETVVGSVSQVSGEALQRTGGVSNVGSALTGNLPGLITSASTGMPGEENPQIVIRGVSSWNSGGPLILVDGLERPEFFAQMDIGSVESISILKDASATAVFGSRGANGVIIVTTKRGALGRAEVSARVNTTMKSASKLPLKFDAYDAIGVRNLAIERELGANPGGWANYIPESVRYKYRFPSNAEEAERYPNIDWQDVLFKDVAMSYNANVGIRGGTNFVKYFSSLDYQNEGDLMRNYDNNRGYDPGYSYNRINVRSNLDFNLTPSTVFRVDLGGTYGIRKAPWTGNNGNDQAFWGAAYNNAPDAFMPIYSDGYWGFAGPSGGGVNSIRVLAVGGVKYFTTTTITSNFVLEQNLDKLIKGLNFRGAVSLDNRFREVDRGINDENNDAIQKFIDPWTGAIQFSRDMDTNGRFDYFEPTAWTTGVGYVEGGQRRSYYQAQLNYANTFWEDHNLTAMGMFSRQIDALGNQIPRYREDWVFRTTYNYKGKYMLEYNGAYNGSEQFSPDYRFSYYSSGGLGYMVSEENFLKNVNFLDMLKFKGSYGEVGDDLSGLINPPRFLYMDEWVYGNQSYMGNRGDTPGTSPYVWYRQTTVGNPSVRWETAYKYNAGAEFSILQGLVKGEFNWFHDNRNDIFMSWDRAIPTYFGIGAPQANLGRTTTRGYELELHFNKQINPNLKVWADFAMTHAKSNVLFRDDREFEEEYRKNAGYPIGQTRNVIGQGFYNTWDELYAGTPHQNNNINRFPGGYLVSDYNGDGIIDNFDSAPYGYPTIPENTYNTNIGIDYKGLSLFLQFYGVNNVTREVSFASLSNNRNLVFEEGSYWSKDNISADSPLPRWSVGSSYLNADRYLFDGSYLRLKNAELAFRFQPSHLRRLGISTLRVFANGNNLFLWTKMPDDREANFGPGSGGQGTYPTMRRFNLGFNLTF